MSPWALRQRELAEESQLIRGDINQFDEFTDSVQDRAQLFEEEQLPSTEIDMSLTELLMEQLRAVIEAQEEESIKTRAGPPPPMLGGQRQVICVDGAEGAQLSTTTRPVIDIDGGAQGNVTRNAGPTTPAQQHMGQDLQAGPMHVDISSLPTTPRSRAKREAGARRKPEPEGAHESDQQLAGGVAHRPDGAAKQCVGHLTTRIDSTGERVAGMEKAYQISDT